MFHGQGELGRGRGESVIGHSLGVTGQWWLRRAFAKMQGSRDVTWLGAVLVAGWQKSVMAFASRHQLIANLPLVANLPAFVIACRFLSA